MTRAGEAALLPVPVVVLIVGAVLAPLAGRLSRRLPMVVAVAATGGATATLAVVAPTVYSGHLLVHYLGHWTPVRGASLGIAFAADPFGLSYALAVTVIGMVLAVFTLSLLSGLGKGELGGYACLFLLLDAALVGTALTADLFNLFVWFEVAALASYALTGFFLERPVALEAAFKTLVLTTVASFCVFVGTALLYAAHGALNFGQLHNALRPGLSTVDLVALGLLIAGYATKAGLIPFHGWLPDAHTAAPGPVSALFSALMVNLGLVAIGRLVYGVYGPRHGVLGLLTVLGLVSALGGALLALVQDDFKRVLAYDTVSQLGVLLVGLATGSRLGLAGTTYHLLNHALFKALLFLCAGSVLHSTGVERLSEMGGLARRMPVVTGAFVVGVLSIAGIPPFNGYSSLGMIHRALEDGHAYPVLAVLLLAQVVTVAALARAAWLAFFQPRESDYEVSEPLRPGMAAGFGALATLCVAFGVLHGLLLPHVLAPAAGWLADGPAYGHAVLAGGGTLRTRALDFVYLDPILLVTVLVTAAAGLALAYRVMRGDRAARLLRPLTALQTGSVNDYAAYLVVGLLVVCATLLLTG
jgi:multicomponent Na+:H+ antiporter subunit D